MANTGTLSFVPQTTTVISTFENAAYLAVDVSTFDLDQNIYYQAEYVLFGQLLLHISQVFLLISKANRCLRNGHTDDMFSRNVCLSHRLDISD